LHVANATAGHPKERTLDKNRQSIRRKRGHAVTIDEVAKQANVSPMTVSRVVNGHGKVRESTRERVMHAVQELGYAPNLAARALAAASGTRIALIYTNPSAAFLSELLVGALGLV
jgi:LacI family transcriptional regulator